MVVTASLSLLLFNEIDIVELDFFNFQNVNELPSYENAAGDLDNLDDLLQVRINMFEK